MALSTGAFRWVGITAAWVYVVLFVLLELVDTCTGGGEGHLPGLLAGGPFSLIAVICLYLWPAVSLDSAQKVGLVFAVTIGLLVAVPLFVVVTLGGKVVCGLEFSVDRGLVAGVERWVPLAHMFLLLVIASRIIGREHGPRAD